MKSTHFKQKGAVLVVSLIILVLMTLLAVTSFNIGKSNLQIVSNMQRKNETVAAAQVAIDSAVSKTLFTTTPAAAFLNPCGGVANTLCVDSNGDGVNDITVTLTPAPTCVKAQTVLNANLDLSNTEDAGCAVGVGQNFGVGGATGNSLCADSMWEINAVATDNSSNATVTVTEGVAVRVSTDSIATACP